MEPESRQTNELARRKSPAGKRGLSVRQKQINLKKAVWLGRILAVVALVLAAHCDHAHHPVTALAFGLLGFGAALVVSLMPHEDWEWIETTTIGLSGLAIFTPLFHLVGLG